MAFAAKSARKTVLVFVLLTALACEGVVIYFLFTSSNPAIAPWRENPGKAAAGNRGRDNKNSGDLQAGQASVNAPAVSAFDALSSPPLRIGSTPQLFVDECLVGRLDGARLELHSPVPREVCFEFDAPWEGPECGYVTVFRDGSQFRMVYRGGGESTREVTCLAESADGIRWNRPSLGLIEFNGSKDNNIIWTARRASYGESHNFTPFLDTNPACLPEERYKAVALLIHPDESGEQRRMLAALVSRDCIHWQRMGEKPIIRSGSFDSQNTAFWDAARERYVCFSRIGREGKRSIQISTSADFRFWFAPKPLDFGAPPLEQFYTTAIVPYSRAPEILLGFPMRFVPERKSIGVEGIKTDGVSDAVFMASRDGFHWTRLFMEAFIRPGLDQANWGHAHGNNTPAFGILDTAPGELSIYWAENYGKIPRLRRGTLRVDGFASVHGPWKGGEMITRPLIFKGRRLVMNYSPSAVGAIRVEVQQDNGTPFAGLELSHCPEIYGDEIEREVRWEGGADLTAAAGHPARFRFSIKDADLYSFRILN